MERLSDDVARELSRVSGGQTGGMARIVDVWQETVGRTIAKNAWPARIARDGTLHVATSSSSWAFELQQLEADIVRRLRATAGAAAPNRVRFAVGTLPEVGPADDVEEVGKTAEPGPADVARANEIASPIEDEELRTIVARAAAQSLANAASNRPF